MQGFDTARSTDHAWGPRLQVFLTAQDFDVHGAVLDERLDAELPHAYRGHPVRFAFPDGAPARHWVHVVEVDAFFEGFLGAVPSEPLTDEIWLATPTQVLRELTGGAVFHDGLGVLHRYRAELAWYPADVWRYVLACQWMRLANEEPFVGRCGEVGDDLGSAVVTARQVRDLMRLSLLQDRVFPPYSKWLGTAFAGLPCAVTLAPVLSAALAAGDWQERERLLSEAYDVVARRHNDLGLTEELDPRVRPFHTRPFQVLGSERFASALLASVVDECLRVLPPVGAVDQFVDSTELSDRVFLHRRAELLHRRL